MINDLDLNINENYDLTFIDTWHVYGQLKRELDKFSKITNKYIIMHDTTVDELLGESIRCNMDAKKQSEESEYQLVKYIKDYGRQLKNFYQIIKIGKLNKDLQIIMD